MPSALITGANRGIGLEFARQYLADGWQIYAACRDPDSASELRRLADGSGHKLKVMALDVTDPRASRRLLPSLTVNPLTFLLTMLASWALGGSRVCAAQLRAKCGGRGTSVLAICVDRLLASAKKRKPTSASASRKVRRRGCPLTGLGLQGVAGECPARRFPFGWESRCHSRQSCHQAACRW